MILEDKKEILKAYFYKYEKEIISKIFDITVEDIDKIIGENKDYLKELEGRDYA